MKKIKLTQGKFALVDDEDYDYLNQWNWYAHKRHGIFYAIRNGSRKDNNGKQAGIKMHRIVLDVIDPKILIDHIDHNGLNNCKSNLRTAQPFQNAWNMVKRKGISKYKGVCLHYDKKTWTARIVVFGKRKFLGRFKSEEMAAAAYNNAAMNAYGEFAYLNQVKCG